jgi:peptidyl-tRNA hydrolase, PTH2 family
MNSLFLPINSDTTKAFCAGVLLPTIAFYFWNTARLEREKQRRQLLKDDDDDDDDDDEDEDDLFETNDDSKPLASHQQLPLEWDMRHAPYKLLLVVNMELSMGKGKICAQCCHAALGVYQRALSQCPAAVRAWERTGCAKIAVKCPTLDELETIAVLAQKSKRMPFYLVEDAGRTQIAAGSRTVLGLFGPVSIFDGFTDHLKLM